MRLDWQLCSWKRPVPSWSDLVESLAVVSCFARGAFFPAMALKALAQIRLRPAAGHSAQCGALVHAFIAEIDLPERSNQDEKSRLPTSSYLQAIHAYNLVIYSCLPLLP